MYANQPPPMMSDPREKVELYFGCRGLINLDVMSKSDPFIIVYEQPLPKPGMPATAMNGVWNKICKIQSCPLPNPL